MNLSSVIVIPHPDRIRVVEQALQELDGVELHAISPDGKMIITIETNGDRETVALFETIGQLDGVLSVSMVYHQQEADPEAEIRVEA